MEKSIKKNILKIWKKKRRKDDKNAFWIETRDSRNQKQWNRKKTENETKDEKN